MNKTKSFKINIKTYQLCLLATGIIAVMFLLYVYFINVSVMNGSKFEILTDKISNLQTEIAEAELQIVEAKREINKEIALEQGFEELDQIVFVTRNRATALNAITN